MSNRVALRMTIDLSRFCREKIPFVMTARDAPTVLSPCVLALRDALAGSIDSDETLRVGAVLVANGNAECTVSIVRGTRVGAAAIFRWKPDSPGSARLTVSEYSPGRMRWIWGALVTGLVLGIAGAKLVLPTTIDAPPRFLAGIGAGVVIGLGLVITSMRLHLGIDLPESSARAQRMALQVEAWLTLNNAKIAKTDAAPSRG